MMRSDIVGAIQGLLTSTGAFSTVCGIGSEKPVYPLARVWANGSQQPNLENTPQAMLDLRVAVQIETMPVVDAFGNTDESTLYNLVDATFAAIHNVLLPGRGAKHLIVLDNPGLSAYEQSKPMVYLLQVSVRVLPDVFSLT